MKPGFGRPGSGKSRMLSEAALIAQTAGFAVTRAVARSQRGATQTLARDLLAALRQVAPLEAERCGASRIVWPASGHEPTHAQEGLEVDARGKLQQQLSTVFCGVAKLRGVGETQDAARIALRLPAFCGVPTREEAEQVLRSAVGRDRENPFAWYQLGMVYGATGDIPRARLASAEQQIMSGRPREALQNAEAAEQSLPRGSTDWIRAGDVALQARAELERERDRN